MKKASGEMVDHRLQIGQRLKCGEVFIKNLDGYASACTVECQLCGDKIECDISEFLDHIEIWHSDWEDELQSEEMQKVANEIGTSGDEIDQPFEKVFIVTETKSMPDLTFFESEENSEISESFFNGPDEDYNGYNDCLEGQPAIAYTVNVSDILKTTKKSDSQKKLRSKVVAQNLHQLESDSKNGGINNLIDVNKVLIDRSEDSGVEKSEGSSLTASTPQHSTSEDEASCEPRNLTLAEIVRLAMNEHLPKPKLTSAHMEKLIELYEMHPRLWQQTHPEYNKLPLCRKSWKEITRTWNRACKQNFSINDIRVRISTLCQRYLKERKRREMAYEINEPKIDSIVSRFRYYDKLKFLDSKQNNPYKELTFRITQEHEKLIEVYSHFPELWCCRDRHQKSVELRDKAYQDMSTALQLLGIHMPTKLIRQRITALRKRYRLEKMRHLHCKLQGKTFEVNFKQYESMKFLDRHIAPFVCGTCGKIFRKIQEYQTHIVLKEHEEYEKYCESGESTRASLFSTTCEKYNDVSVSDISELRETVDELQEQNSQENNSSLNHRNFNIEPHNLLKTTSTPYDLKTYEYVENDCTQDNVALINNSLNNAVLHSTKNNIGLQNDASGENIVSFGIDIGDQTGECNNFINLPIVFGSMTGNKDLRYFSDGGQFYTLTPNDIGNHLTLNNINSIENGVNQSNENNSLQANAIYVDSMNNFGMQNENLITYQVLDNGIEIAPDSQNFVPVELLLNEPINNLAVTTTTQEGEKYELVAQYLNENNIIPITTIVNETAQSSISSETMEILDQNTAIKPIPNDYQLIPVTMNFEESCEQRNAEKNYEEDENVPVAKETPKDLVTCCEEIGKNQILSKTLKRDSKNVIERPLNTKTISEDHVTSSYAIKKKKTEEEAKIIGSIESSSGDKPDKPDSVTQQKDREVTTTPPKLTAKIECGDIQLEIDLSPSQKDIDDTSEQTLLGRLPREKALELITLYRDYPELWHPENPSYNSRQLRRSAWRSLTNELNGKLRSNFNWLQVQRKILDYVKYYRHERRRIQSRRGCTQWSFYDHFDFLDEVMSLPNDLEKRIQQRTQTLKIIEIYEAHPQIWDTTHPDYTKRRQRQRTIAQMCARLQDVHNLTIEHSKLKQRLLELRKEYRSTKIARVAALRRRESFEPLLHFEFYEPLHFLEDHVPPFNCTECKVEFKCFTDYNLHMKKVHNSLRRHKQPVLADDIDKSSNENICHICGIKFTLRHNLLQHLNRHYAGRTLPCSVCGKKFFTKNTLMEHERTHSKIPAVICDDCGQTFVNMSKFNQHMKRHRNQRDHECPQCHKLFYSAFDRDSHLRRHLQIRDKLCPVCGKAFVMGSAYYAHIKLHSGKKEYKCPSCDKAFAQYAGLYKHRKRYHPNAES